MLNFTVGIFCQNINISQQFIDELIEDIAQNINAKVDYSQITEELYYYIDNPININNTTAETLEKIRVLNPFQIKSLLNYVKIHGGIVTLYELQLVAGFNYTTIQNIIPFITISTNNDFNKWQLNKALKYGNSTIFARIQSTLEIPNGYIAISDSAYKTDSNHYYLGNRSRIYSRYKFNYKNKLQWGITTEKDPGEQFAEGNQPYGFDFYSTHLQINDVGIIKTAIIGDYQVQFGQGLIMWSYINMSKSLYIMNIKKNANGINRYSSTDENAFLRGGGITLSKGQFSLTTFGSYKNIDANISHKDTTNNITYFSSFLNTGIHSLPSEIKNNNSIKETIWGESINWRYNNVKIGVYNVNYHFNTPYKPANTPYNTFKFSGTNNSNISTDIELRFNSIHLFSEVAMSQNQGKAIIAGALMELTPQISTSILYRNYDKNYQALYSNAFSEGSNTQNEEGFFMGIELHPIKRWQILGYYDFYKFAWLKLLTQGPSKGNDYLVQVDFTTSHTVNMYWRYKHESKEINSDNKTSKFINLSRVNKSLLRYNITYKIADNWELRNRIELSFFNKDAINETGYMLYQDIMYKPSKYPLAIIVRYATFDTKSYNTRIYTYENDILNIYSIPPLYSKGTRTYILLQYNLFKKLSLWLRLSQTNFTNKTEIGSGLNQINGNTKTNIKFQIRYKF